MVITLFGLIIYDLIVYVGYTKEFVERTQNSSLQVKGKEVSYQCRKQRHPI